MHYIWAVVLLPFVGAVWIGLKGRSLPHQEAHKIAITMVASSFTLAVIGFFHSFLLGGQPQSLWGPLWVGAEALRVRFGLLLDPLSLVMMLVVTGVSLLIHVYSIGYMHGDPGYGRYFAFLNLFVGSMLTLVLADNFLLLFVGWELVGLCSYLLIGFWFERERATNAGKKAFIVNRIGDAGFLLGMALLWSTFGSLHYSDIFPRASEVLHGRPWLATAIGLLLFLGATGKSAQLPLYVWLPDAMEGPTPVSALIHAATMVTAGVYMVARASALYAQAPLALALIALIGVLTALFAATVALAQTDIKRVLAYSTISQLGYMFLGCGVGAFWAALFHLMTHAFFKALLFMGAGSVIHALQEEMDIRRMGGLKEVLPTTHKVFLVAVLAIAGFPLFSGFFSKDAILYAAWHARRFPFPSWLLWGLGMGTAFLTALYMMRLYALTFLGKPRAAPEVLEHAHEAPPVMLRPMVVLAFLSVVGGVVGIPGLNLMEPWIRPATTLPPWAAAHHPSVLGEWLAALVSAGVALAGLAMGYHLFAGPSPWLEVLAAHPLAQRLPELAREQWRVEWAYRRFLVEPGFRFTAWLTEVVEPLVIDGFVNALAGTMLALGQGFRRWQTGYVRNYALAFTLGAFVVVAYFLFAHLFVGGGH